MAINKIIKVSTLSVLFGVAAFSSAFGTKGNGFHKSNAEGEPTVATPSYTPDSFEVEAPTDLKALITSSTKTSKAHSLVFSFSTGGTGYSDSNGTMTLAPNPDDPNYQSVMELEDESKEVKDFLYIDNRLKENIDNIPTIDGYVWEFKKSTNKTEICVPRKLYRTNFLYSISPSYIKEGALNCLDLKADKQYNFYIPSNITKIFSNSFTNLDQRASNVTFRLEIDEATANASFDAGWNQGAKVEYNVNFADYTSSEVKGSSISVVTETKPVLVDGQESKITIDGEEKTVVEVTKEETKREALVYICSAIPKDVGNTNVNLFLGYNLNGKGEYLYLEYKFVGSDEVRYTPFILDRVYMSVGKKISSFTTSANVDIPLAENQEIDLTSLMIHNIHDSITDETVGFKIDEEKSYRIKPVNNFKKTYDISNFIEFKYTGISEFANYISIAADLKVTNPDIYKDLKASIYKQYKANIDANKCYIRYRVSSLSLGRYYIDYGNGDAFNKYIESPVNQYVLGNGNNSITYILNKSSIGQDFKASDIKVFDFIGLYVTIDLYGENGPVARSSVSTRFGYVPIIRNGDHVEPFNINALLIIVSLSYLASYMALGTAYFFYRKNRYKNDEFRRLKPKSFITKALLGLFGSLIVILAILFVIFRSTLFNNAIVVFNPFDPFIIGFVIASVLIIGYFIKFVVVTTKANNHVRKTRKLKLDQDVVEDGTN